MNCPSCGHLNPLDARFCSSCGQDLRPSCTNCGAPNPPGARFCSSCGSAVGVQPPGSSERKLVTILFADVTGSTALAERLDPEDLHGVMQSYFEAMRDELEAEGGTVEKFIGDAVMAAFGVPTAHEDDPARALRAALRMGRRLGDVNRRLLDRFGVELEMRVGVNTGDALTAIEPQPGEAMVTGEVVNVAARLQTAAEPGQVLVAERTARAVRGFGFEDVGKVEIRGRSQPVRALRLVGQKPATASGGVPGLHAPMVGRDSEMDLLRATFRRVRSDRHADLVTIYGDPGVGKSRLAREFLEWAETLDRPPMILQGRCPPYGEGITYWPLAEMMADLAELKDDETAEQALQRVRELGDRLFTHHEANDPEATVAALAHTIGLEDPKYMVPDRDPMEVRAAIQSAWRTLFSALSQESPLILVVEDIHWADHALLDLLEILVDRIAGPVMFLCPARPALLESRPGWGGGRRNVTFIQLDPLSAADSSDLIRFLLSIEDLPAGIHHQILEKAGGNPFFLEEIIRSLIDEGRVVSQDGTWHAAGSLDTVRIPDTVQAVLAARIDRLGPDEKQVLQRAAVVGRTFWTGPLERLLDGQATQLREVLDRLEHRELIRSQLGSSVSGEQEYVFQHVLTREVAYESLPRAERGAAHALVAAWIEESNRDRAGELVGFSVYHYENAYRACLEDGSTDPDTLETLRTRAFKVTLDAGVSARRRAALTRAAKLSEKALSLARTAGEKSMALRLMGRVANSDYAGDRAWAALKESADILLADEEADVKETARACAYAVEVPTRWPGSMREKVSPEEIKYYIDSGLSVLDASDEGAEKVRLLTARAFQVWSAGYKNHSSPHADDVAAARADAREACRMAMELDRPDLASAALDALGSIDVLLGQYGQLLSIVEKRLEIAERIENPWEIGDITASASWAYAMGTDYSRALEMGLQGFEKAQGESRGIQLHNLSWATYSAFWLGKWDLILEEITPKVLSLLGDRLDEPPPFTTHHFGPKAMISVLREDPAAGLDISRLETMQRRHQGEHPAKITGWLEWLRAREGKWDDAVHAIAKHGHDLGAKPLFEIVRASIMFDSRRLHGAHEFLAEAREFAADNTDRLTAPHFDRLEGIVVCEEGRIDDALDLLYRAAKGFAEIGTVWELARTDLELAEVELMRDNSSAARRLAAGALTTFADLSSRREIRAANQMLDDIDRH